LAAQACRLRWERKRWHCPQSAPMMCIARHTLRPSDCHEAGDRSITWLQDEAREGSWFHLTCRIGVRR
jgi:hypothetical protein